MTADLEQLADALHRGDGPAFSSLADRIARNRSPAAHELLLQALQHHSPAIRATAAQSVGLLDTLEAVNPLFMLLQDPDSAVRAAALRALIELAPGLLTQELRQPGPVTEGRQRLRDLVRVLRGEVPEPTPRSTGAAWPGFPLRALKLCIALLHHEDSAIRVRSAELLGAAQDRRAIDELLIALAHPDPQTRKAAAQALGEHGKTSRIVGPLVEAFFDPDAAVRSAAALALSRFDVLGGNAPADRLRPVLEHLLRHPDIEARRRVVLMLGRSRGAEAVELLLLATQDREASVRAETIVALSRFRDPRIQPVLRVALTDPEEMVRLRAVDAMERLGTPDPLPLALKDPSPTVRVQAIKALRWTGVEPVMPELLASLQDPAEAVRLEVVELLTSHPTPTVVAALARVLPDESFPLIRQKMLATLASHPEEHDAILAAQGTTVEAIHWEHLADPAPEVRAQVLQFLGRRGDAAMVTRLLACQTDPEAEVRLALVRAVERRDPALIQPMLEALLTDSVAEVREAAVWALRFRPVEEALARALPFLADPAESVRLSAATLPAIFHLRQQLGLDRIAATFAQLALPGRLALLEVADGIRDRRLVPLLLGAIQHGEGSERVRALQVLADLKRGEPPRRPPRLTEELHRQAPLDSVSTRSAVRVLDPSQTPNLGSIVPSLAEPLGYFVRAAPIEPGRLVRFEVWAARTDQQDRLAMLTRPQIDDSDHRIQSKYGPTLAPRTSLSVLLQAEGLEPLDAEDDLHWDGEPAAARFAVPIPVTIPPAGFPVRVDILREGLRIATLHTRLRAGPTPLDPLVTTRYQRAVAWAAEEDRPRAEARLTGLRRLLPDLEVRWLGAGETMPETAQVWYLFWSRAVAQMPEVERILRRAREAWAAQRLSLLPLESPQTALLPEDLASVEWVWAYLRGRLRG